MEWVGVIIGALLAGCIVGPLARLFMPGKQDISIWMTILLGAIGAFVGGMLAELLGVGETAGIDWIQWALEIGAAALFVGLYLSRKRGSSVSA